jgi:hypothetical protein
MKFKIEQIAICPADPERAIALLTKMGAETWARDHVVARGNVYDGKDVSNEANLAFNYELLDGAKEFEVLHYTKGHNWMQYHACSVSHLGMHVTADELLLWREFFAAEGINVSQEVMTQSHTNPVIAGKRWYNYVIFNTRGILGVDIKFIVRRDAL